MATFKEISGKKGKKIQVTIRVKGYKTVYKTFSKKSEAKSWALDVEQQMKKGTWNKVNIEKVVTPIITLNDLIDDFEKNVAPFKYAHYEKYKVMYDWWRNKIGHLKLDEITPFVLTQCQNILLNEPPDKPYKGHTTKSISTVRKYMFALSAVLRYAERSLGIISRNPMSKVDKPKKKKKGVERFLSDSERKELLDLCKNTSPMIFIFVLLAMFSGGRYSEVLHLQVEKLDFINEMVFYTGTKNGEDRGVPIYSKVMDLLKQYIKENNITSGYIFINKDGKLAYLKGIFEKIIKNSTIENFRFHDLRHTYASYLARNGASLLEIAELMGHKNLNQVQIYAHLTKKHTSKLVRKMSANEWEFD